MEISTWQLRVSKPETQDSPSRNAVLFFQSRQWLRIALIGVGAALAVAAGVFGYTYFARPVTLTVAAGSADGYAAQIMSAIAARLSQTGSSVRLRLGRERRLRLRCRQSAGKVDLAIIRADIGDLSEVRTVCSRGLRRRYDRSPAGSSIDSIDDLKGKTVGVIGGEAKYPVVEAIKQEYDLAKEKVVFKDLAVADVPQALHSKQSALCCS